MASSSIAAGRPVVVFAALGLFLLLVANRRSFLFVQGDYEACWRCFENSNYDPDCRLVMLAACRDAVREDSKSCVNAVIRGDCCETPDECYEQNAECCDLGAEGRQPANCTITNNDDDEDGDDDN